MIQKKLTKTSMFSDFSQAHIYHVVDPLMVSVIKLVALVSKEVYQNSS